MIVSVFVRRLKEGLTFADFERAWEAEKGFGVPTRVITAVALEDPRDILTVGFVDLPTEALTQGTEDVANQEQVRHSRIDDVIESTTLKAMYELTGEHDFTADPRAIQPGSAESLFRDL